MFTRFACWLSLLFILVVVCSAQDAWTPPELPVANPQLPRLTKALVVDGVLSEWGSAVGLPVRSASDIVWSHAPHRWRGAADAGMNCLLAWTPQGFAFAAQVADDDVYNDREAKLSHEQDGLEIFLDGRTAEKISAGRAYATGNGIYQLCVRAPMPGKASTVYTIGTPDGNLAGVQVAGVRTKTGYTIELLVPWSAFPDCGAKDGAYFGVNVALDDYDQRDGKAVHPFAMTPAAQPMFKLLWQPLKFRLVETATADATTPLEPQVIFALPGMLAGTTPVRITADAAQPLAARIARFRVTITDTAGKTVFEQTVAPKRLPAPWANAATMQMAWLPAGLPDGFYTARLTALAKNGVPLGQSARNTLVAVNSVEGTYARFGAFDMAALAQAEPFKAAAVMGAAAAFEHAKRALELQDIGGFRTALQECYTRLDLLQNGSFDGDRGLCNLLTLAAQPDAQVAVEYPYAGNASILFNWGALPLAVAYVSEKQTPEEAKQATTIPANEILTSLFTPTTVAECPAVVSTRKYRDLPALLDDAAFDRQVLLYLPKAKRGYLLPIDRLAWANVEAISILPGCPDAIHSKLTAWAGKLPTLALDEALQKERILIAGDLRTVPGEPLKGAYLTVATLWERAETQLCVANGKSFITVYAPTQASARRIAELIIAGKPVTAAQVDAIRAEIVTALAPKTPAVPLPAGFNLYCGDLHSHTFYSDGNSSPVANLCEAIYTQMDFLVMSDHNTLLGAQVARKLAGDHRLAYPMVMGEEVTTGWSHFNAYPVTELVPWNGILYDITRAAHRQGAVVQWNHPGFPESTFYREQYPKMLKDSSLDAWEHLPDLYEEWRAAGSLPLLTGTTDTHSGTFDWPERTVLLAASTHGDDIAEAIRCQRAVMLTADGGRLLYGPEDMTSRIWSALAEATALKTAKATALKEALKDVNLVNLLHASPPRAATVEELGG